MKITRDNLLASDYDTLFTRDPGTFIEAIIINLLWADKDNVRTEAETIERQRYVFEKWLEYYTKNIREEIVTEFGINKAKDTKTYRDGHIAGQIHALSTLPMKKSLLTKYVDLIEVANILRQLKAKEPIGVTKDDNTQAPPVH